MEGRRRSEQQQINRAVQESMNVTTEASPASVYTGHPLDGVLADDGLTGEIEKPTDAEAGRACARKFNAKAGKAAKSQPRNAATKAGTRKKTNHEKPTGVTKSSIRKPRAKATKSTVGTTPTKRTRAARAGTKAAASKAQDTAVLEQPEQEMNPAIDNDDTESVLTELTSTPEPPAFFHGKGVSATLALAPDSSAIPELAQCAPPATPGAATGALMPSPPATTEIQTPAATRATAVPTPAETSDLPSPPSTTYKPTRIVRISVDSPAVEKILAQPPSPKSLEPSYPGRERHPIEETQPDQDDGSPLVSKTSRKRLCTAKNEGAPLRKRQATKKRKVEDEISVAPPIEIPTTKSTARTKTATNEKITPAVRKARVSRPEKPSPTLHYLPSPPVSDLDLSTIDPELLALSRALTHREPLDSKPSPVGQSEVWAPGRSELCETLPYFRSYNSGCYSKDGCIYSFMFDNAGGDREYMDSDVIIARMGGSMQDNGNGGRSQGSDHDINQPQPQAMLNNLAFKNPLVIICGSRNEGLLTRLPHRYCVLGWNKPTHIWTEMTKFGKRRPVKTIRYRFERLDLSKPSWYRPNSSTDHSLPKTRDLTVTVKECGACGESCPQVYLIGWICTNWDCTQLWKLPNGQDAPYGNLDYDPAFLLQRTSWDREEPPFDLNPGLPKIGQYFGDNLTEVNTRGVVCPNCGRCNARYLFTGWRCDTPGCTWKLTPELNIMMPKSLNTTPLEMATQGPGLVRSMTRPAVNTQVKFFSNYKVIKYTFVGIEGSVIVAKANENITSEPGGPDDMFRDLQTVQFGLERRMLRKGADDEPSPSQGRNEETETPPEDDVEKMDDAIADPDKEEGEDDHVADAVGTRMSAFGMNFGMPYKFIASGDSRPFEDAPAAIRSARSRLNWAQRVLVNESSGYQDFNEELVFAYLEKQKIKYHDDGEEGLGPRIATLSLGAPATMKLRVKAKYFSQRSKTGVFTYEKPLPEAILESSSKKIKGKSKVEPKPTHEIYADRLAGWEELQRLKQSGDKAGFRARSKKLSEELELKFKEAEDMVSFYLTHGDIVFMVGEDIQKYLEHEVEPHGNLRFALTCRTILPNHLTAEQMPEYEVHPDTEKYDGAAIREDGDGEAVEW